MIKSVVINNVEYVSVKDFAELIGKSKKYVLELVHKRTAYRRLPALFLYRMYLIPLSEVDNLLYGRYGKKGKNVDTTAF